MQVLTDLPLLRDRMAELPNLPTTNDPVNPWNIWELILDTGHTLSLIHISEPTRPY